jgi:putative ABC transport system permease protein
VPASIGNRDKSADASFEIEAAGRLRPGVTLEQANAEFQTLARRSKRKYPASHADRSARVSLLREYVNGDDAKPFMQMLRGAVLFVLLIACANVAGLQFARISLRKGEIAVRGQSPADGPVPGSGGRARRRSVRPMGAYVLRAALPANVARYVPGWSRRWGVTLRCAGRWQSIPSSGCEPSERYSSG